ncbi:DUF6090 family protein [Polaribacter porphyrae]|uniref:Uncharacterized protein n=1 Tax=Polaribacter porphyrae TaxID=1137780 RepID=A0A2S7WQH2_9FLAO|nr:DUF6090 family protein [Polaribacter porphyrae]PQJ79824.1 hypothetical protein BTO18_11840 [Polaribacter porphyrae]
MSRIKKIFKLLITIVKEIVFVVVGILIALAINNWIDNINVLQKELSILNELKNDLNHNIKNTKSGIDINARTQKSCKVILEFFEKKLSHSETLATYFSNFYYFWNPDFAYGSYENLKIKGVDFITNSKLKSEIVDMFEIKLEILDKEIFNRDNRFYSAITLPTVLKYFYKDWNNSKTKSISKPSNYSKMMKDSIFYAMCISLYQSKKFTIINTKNL